MKKLLNLMLLAAGVLAFAACNKEPEPWETLPDTPIVGDALTVNGQSNTDGSLSFMATSATEGILTLTNIVPGYPSITNMPVTLESRSDGSFHFSGEQGMPTPPAINDLSQLLTSKTDIAGPSQPSVAIVKVDGTITTVGQANITTDIVRAPEANGGLNGTWKLLANCGKLDEEGSLQTAPIWVTWNAIDETQANGQTLAQLLRTFASPILFQYLSYITLADNGWLTARYHTGSPVKDSSGDTFADMMTVLSAIDTDADGNAVLKVIHDGPWIDSPQQLVYWYVHDDMIYLLPDIQAIIALATDGNGSEVSGALTPDVITELLAGLGLDLNDPGTQVLVTKILEMVQTGMPLKYNVEGDMLSLTVTKEMAAPFIDVLVNTDLLSMLDETLAEGDSFTSMIIYGMLGISKFTDLKDIWESNTADFSITLNFTR